MWESARLLNFILTDFQLAVDQESVTHDQNVEETANRWSLQFMQDSSAYFGPKNSKYVFLTY